MKRWIVYFVLLLFSIWLGLKIQADPGVVFIRYQHWQIETSLWFALLGFLILWLLLHGAGVLLGTIIHLPNAISRYFNRRSRRRSQQEMLSGFSCLVEGDGASAEKYFVKAAKQKNLPFMNYLLAAKAAQMGHRDQRREHYLKKATEYANDPNLRETLAFFEIEQDLVAGKEEEALARLIPLYKKRPRDPALLKWLKAVYWKTQNWEALWDLLPRLKKVLPRDEFQVLQCQVSEALLKGWVAEDKTLNELLNFWRKLPTQCQSIPDVLLAYIKGLCHYHLQVEAEKLLISAIKQQQDKALVAYYADFNSFRKEKQIALLESVLLKSPQDPELLFCVGHWYARHQLWGKAEHYLTQSLVVDPKQQKARFELGHLYLQLGNRQKAIDVWVKMDIR